jgi:hexosaminidase
MKPALIFILAFCVSCNQGKIKPGITIIPQPGSLIETGRFFKLKSRVTVCSSEDKASKVISVFSGQVKDFIQVQQGAENKSDIEIRIDAGKFSEGYFLEVRKDKIIISASTLNGAFYGLQSLRQLILFSEKKNNKLLIPVCQIEDAPKYLWRGVMLDESRHFFGAAKVKQLLDMMALHKLNTFHWHLTDAAGWRLEIKKYPYLTTVGGTGNHSDPQASAKYYTQEQIKEIVKYAADRFIQVVPEIDMPGHAGASNKAYPEFSGGGSEEYPEFTFNPGYEGTYAYLTDILTEVTELFPSSYIHIGGDEVHFGNQQWNSNQQVKALMRRNKLPDLKAVEKYFVRRMADTIKSLNRITIGWDEIIDAQINPGDALVMWWRHDRQDQLKNAFEGGYNIVLCPRIPLYFDFVQDKEHKWGRRWGGAFSELENVYGFPPDTLNGFKQFSKQVAGIQANLWSEVIHENKRLDFMTYPRLSAMAEAAWTKNERKNYDDFLLRLSPLLNYLKEMDIYYFNPFSPELTPEPPGPTVKK